MQLYNINNDNTLDAQSLHERQKLDPVTYYQIGDNQIIADGDLPTIADNQAYYVGGERNADGHYTVSANVSVIADYRNQTAYNKATKEPVKITELGDINDALTLLAPATQYDEFVDGLWVLTDTGRAQQLDDYRARAARQIDGAVAAINTRLVPFLKEYEIRLAECEQYKDDGYPALVPEQVLAVADELGITAQQAADLVIAQGAAFHAAQIQLGNLRMRKLRFARLNTIDEIETVVTDTLPLIAALDEVLR